MELEPNISELGATGSTGASTIRLKVNVLVGSVFVIAQLPLTPGSMSMLTPVHSRVRHPGHSRCRRRPL